MTILTEAPDDDRRSLNTPMKIIGYAVLVIGLTGSIFSAGYNWRSVALVELKQQKFEEEYVRKDVQQWQLASMTQQLMEISRQLDEVRAELKAQRRP